MAEYCFILNPIAGAGASLRLFAEAERLLEERQVEYAVLRSEYAGHATLLAEEALAAGHGCIVAVGGDGTALEVARALLNTGRPMGILPAGTGNDFCRALGIPSNNIGEAVHILLDNAPRPVDAACANGIPFCNIAGVGWDVEVLVQTDRYKQNHSGMAAYLLGIARAFLDLSLKELTITTEEKTIEARALLVAVANGSHYGGGMAVAPRALPTDGLLDVCLIRDITRPAFVCLLPFFLKGKHLKNKHVEYWRTKKVRIESKDPIRLQRDGEAEGTTPVEIEILPGALMMKCK